MEPLCDYGCGQPANHILKNKMKCCGTLHTKCPSMIKKMNNNKVLWNKGLTKEDHPSLIKMGWNKGLTKETNPILKANGEKISKSNKGKKKPRSFVNKLQKRMTGLTDENHPSWKGGSYDYWHRKAWKLFGKDKCEKCGITLEKYQRLHDKRFDMHNNLNPKDYTIMESYAWSCLCEFCHSIEENK